MPTLRSARRSPGRVAHPCGASRRSPPVPSELPRIRAKGARRPELCQTTCRRATRRQRLRARRCLRIHRLPVPRYPAPRRQQWQLPRRERKVHADGTSAGPDHGDVAGPGKCTGGEAGRGRSQTDPSDAGQEIGGGTTEAPRQVPRNVAIDCRSEPGEVAQRPANKPVHSSTGQPADRADPGGQDAEHEQRNDVEGTLDRPPRRPPSRCRARSRACRRSRRSHHLPETCRQDDVCEISDRQGSGDPPESYPRCGSRREQQAPAPGPEPKLHSECDQRDASATPAPAAQPAERRRHVDHRRSTMRGRHARDRARESSPRGGRATLGARSLAARHEQRLLSHETPRQRHVQVSAHEAGCCGRRLLVVYGRNRVIDVLDLQSGQVGRLDEALLGQRRPCGR